MARRPSKGAHTLTFILIILAYNAAAQGSDEGGWSFNTYAGINNRLALDSGVIYSSSGDGTVYAFNESTGNLIWRTKLPSRCGDPILHEGLLIETCENRIVYGLARNNGTRIWSQMFPSEIRSNPAINGGRVYLGDERGRIYALNPNNGKTLWETRVGGPVHTTLLAAEDQLYVSSDDGRLYALRLSNGTGQWNFSATSPIRSSPAIYHDYVYVGADNNNLYAIEKYSGAMKWSFNASGQITVRPLVSREGVFFGASDGTFYGLDNLGGLKWTYKSQSYFNADATMYRGQIYVPDNDHHMLVLDPGNGSLIRNYTTQGYFTNPPMFSMGRMMITSFDGLRVYGEKTEARIVSVKPRKNFPLMNENTEIDVTVSNTGDLIIDPVNVTFYLDGRYVAYRLLKLNPHSTDAARFNITLSAGRHLLEADRATSDNLAETGGAKDGRVASIVDVGDYWPMFRHDESRKGASDAVDKFSEPTEKVFWTCYHQNDTYPDTYSPSFIASLLGGGDTIGGLKPRFKCQGNTETLGFITVNLSCRTVNYSGYISGNERVLRGIGNLSSGDIESPGDFNVSWVCDAKAENTTYPFNNATLDYYCAINRWHDDNAQSLWNCRLDASSGYSMRDYAAFKGVNTPRKTLQETQPRDYGLEWSFNTGQPIYSSPVTADLDSSDDGNLEMVFSSSDGTTYALHSNGSTYWTQHSDATIHSSPLLSDLDGDGLYEAYFGDDAGILYALTHDGRRMWTFKAAGPIKSSPLPVDFGETHGKGLVFGSDDGVIYFLNAKGERLWDYKTQDKVQSSPALGDIDGDGKKEVIIGSDDNNLYVMAIPPYRYWTYRTNDDVSSTPIAYNDSDSIHTVFGSRSGVFSDLYYMITSYDEGSRKCEGGTCSQDYIPVSSLISSWAFVLKDPIESSPLLFDPYNNGSRYFSFGSDDGSLYIMDNEGNRLIRYSANRHIRSSPASISLDGATNDILFGDDLGRVFIITPNGTAKWTYDTGGAIRTSPAVSDINGDRVLESIITSTDGRVYVFGYRPSAYNLSAVEINASTATTTTQPPATLPTTTTSITLETTSTTASTTTSSTTVKATTTTASTTTSTQATTSTTTSTVTSTTTTQPTVPTTTTSTTSSTGTTTSTASSTTTSTPTTTSTEQKPATSTTLSAPPICEPSYYTGVSAEPCVNGTALNSVVFIPSTDLTLSVVHVINASGANVTITDNLMTRIAYTVNRTNQGSVLNSTVTLKSGELYIIGISQSGGCAQKPPSMRTITPDGTWFVQDMWCSNGDNCPMAVELYPAACEREPPTTAPQSSDLPPSGDETDTGTSSVDGGKSMQYLIVVAGVFILALIFGASYAKGKKRRRGGEMSYLAVRAD